MYSVCRDLEHIGDWGLGLNVMPIRHGMQNPISGAERASRVRKRRLGSHMAAHVHRTHAELPTGMPEPRSGLQYAHPRTKALFVDIGKSCDLVSIPSTRFLQGIYIIYFSYTVVYLVGILYFRRCCIFQKVLRSPTCTTTESMQRWRRSVL